MGKDKKQRDKRVHHIEMDDKTAKILKKHKFHFSSLYFITSLCKSEGEHVFDTAPW